MSSCQRFNLVLQDFATLHLVDNLVRFLHLVCSLVRFHLVFNLALGNAVNRAALEIRGFQVIRGTDMSIDEPLPTPENECLDLVWVLVGSMRKCVAAGWRENHAAQKMTHIAFLLFRLFIRGGLSLCISHKFLCSICAYLCVRVLQELVWRAGCVAVHSLKLDRASILPLLGSLTASHRASRQHAACCLCASLFL